MRIDGTGLRKAALWTVVLLVALGLGRSTALGKDKSAILGVYGVGGVISENGTLWQYMPDEKRWMTIDEAFKSDGRETHVLPLPVAPKEIRFMESWGFLVARDGRVWHYNLDRNRWEDVGKP